MVYSMKSKTLFAINTIIWYILLAILVFTVLDVFNAEVFTAGDNLFYIMFILFSGIIANVGLLMYAENKQIKENN